MTHIDDIIEWPSSHDPGGKVKLTVDSKIQSTAKFSACGKYRQVLTRTWDQNLPHILFIGMNPSVADAHYDDPTIKKETKFCKRWGYGTLIKCNVMDYRATNPKNLLSLDIPQTEENISTIKHQINMVEHVVCVWGKLPSKLWPYEQKIIDVLQLSESKLFCLGNNIDGSPKHPLYLQDTTNMTPFKLYRR